MTDFWGAQQALRLTNTNPHWDLVRWSNALAGETGEACNIVKKVDRDYGGELDDEHRAALAEEIGDILAYTLMLAEKAGIDASDAFIAKFKMVANERKHIPPETLRDCERRMWLPHGALDP